MKKKWADKWVKALRSGKYQQIRGQLFRDREEQFVKDILPAGYCCMGVLAHLVRPDRPPRGINLPGSIVDEVGMNSDRGELPSRYFRRVDSLVGMNDDAGRNFKQIADTIEKHWREL